MSVPVGTYNAYTLHDVPVSAPLTIQLTDLNGVKYYSFTYDRGYSGPSGPTGGITGPALLDFAYEYNGLAKSSAEYKLLGEITTGPTGDYTIVLNVPVSEMRRMMIYQSAWNTIDPATGLTMQGFIGGGTYGQTGTTIIDPLGGYQVGPDGYTGPHVALLLATVLSNINYLNPGLETRNRLNNLNLKFASLGATSGSPAWDDDAAPVNQNYPIGKIYEDQDYSFGNTGAESFLSRIPVESISSIINLPRDITQLIGETGGDGATHMFYDIDTLSDGANAPWNTALHSLFEEAVAYGRVDDTIFISTSDPVNEGFLYGTSGTTGITGQTGGADTPIAQAWSQTGRQTYGVDFQVGDSITLYMTYALSKERRFAVDDSIPALQGFATQALAYLTINTPTGPVNVPLSQSGASFISDPTQSNVVLKKYNLILRATEDTVTSVFDTA